MGNKTDVAGTETAETAVAETETETVKKDRQKKLPTTVKKCLGFLAEGTTSQEAIVITGIPQEYVERVKTGMAASGLKAEKVGGTLVVTKAA